MFSCPARIVETSLLIPPNSSFQRDNMSLPALGYDSSNFKKLTNKPRILLKTKDRCRKDMGKAGMSMKTNILSHAKPECY